MARMKGLFSTSVGCFTGLAPVVEEAPTFPTLLVSPQARLPAFAGFRSCAGWLESVIRYWGKPLAAVRATTTAAPMGTVLLLEGIRRGIYPLSTLTLLRAKAEFPFRRRQRCNVDAPKMHPLFRSLCLIICSGIFPYLNKTAQSDIVFSKVSFLVVFAGI